MRPRPQESDGIDEALSGSLHLTVTTIARALEVLTREREKRARQEEEMSRAATREYLQAMGRGFQDETEAQLPATPAQEGYLHGVGLRPPDRDLTMYEASAILTSFEAHDLARGDVHGAERLLDQLQKQGPAFLEQEAERARAQATEERTSARADQAEATRLMTEADAADRKSEERPFALLDTIDENHTEPYYLTRDQAIAHLERSNGEHTTFPYGEASSWRGIDPDVDRLLVEKGFFTARQIPSSPGQDADKHKDAAAAQRNDRSRAAELRDDAGHAYDSAERREEMAKGFDHIENQAAVDARVRSDVAQGRPATEAVSHTPGKAPKARKTRSGPSTARTAQRTSHGR